MDGVITNYLKSKMEIKNDTESELELDLDLDFDDLNLDLDLDLEELTLEDELDELDLNDELEDLDLDDEFEESKSTSLKNIIETTYELELKNIEEAVSETNENIKLDLEHLKMVVSALKQHLVKKDDPICKLILNNLDKQLDYVESYTLKSSEKTLSKIKNKKMIYSDALENLLQEEYIKPLVEENKTLNVTLFNQDISALKYHIDSFPHHTFSVFRRKGYKTIGSISKLTNAEFNNIRGIGVHFSKEIINFLKSEGLRN